LVALDLLGDALYEDRRASAIPVGRYGPLTNNTPLDSNPKTLEGVHSRGFVEDYYYRVHIRPSHIDLGNTTSAQTREVEVWNAWFVANELADIVATNDQGMTLSGPSVSPTSFGPLESRIYLLSVTPNGPPIVNAAFRFDFALDDPVLRALGRRIVGWVLAPDWSEPVIERLEWMTDVMESHVGVEQRVRLRAEPRRSFEYRVLLGTDQARAQLENRLISWQARVYGLPVWTDASIAVSGIAAGTTSLSMSTLNKDYVVGGILGLVNGLRSEFAEITAVTANSVTLNDPIASDWPVGTKILPVRSARVQNDLGVAYLTDAIAAARPQFQLEGEWPITPATESQDYLGHPVMLTAPNWTEDLEGRFGRKWQDIDYLTGRRAIDDLTGVASVNRTHRWLLLGRAAIAAFRAWLAARAGKLKPFWLPSFQSDLAVVAPVGDTDAFLTLENRGYAEGPVAAVGRRDLMITTVSGARFYRRVTAASEIDAAREMVALDNGLGTTLQPNDFRQISFMRLVRLDTDKVEIAHVTDEVAEVVLSLRSLRDDL
jgi:hypothetical protein